MQQDLACRRKSLEDRAIAMREGGGCMVNGLSTLDPINLSFTPALAERVLKNGPIASCLTV